jgi:periplasmic protein CpxP/Spy
MLKQVKLAIAATAALAALMGIGTVVSAQPGPGMGPGGPGGPCMGPDCPGMGPGKGMMMHHKKGAGHLMGPGARLDMMTAHLGLTPEQRYKILPILDEQAKEMKAVRADENLTRAQVRTRMLDIHKKYDGQIRPLLTPEQQKKSDEMKAKMMERCKARQDAKKQQPAQPQK